MTHCEYMFVCYSTSKKELSLYASLKSLNADFHQTVFEYLFKPLQQGIHICNVNVIGLHPTHHHQNGTFLRIQESVGGYDLVFRVKWLRNILPTIVTFKTNRNQGAT